MGSSLSKSHLPRNYWPEETGQVKGSPRFRDKHSYFALFFPWGDGVRAWARLVSPESSWNGASSGAPVSA